jgi:hypothetical protein
MLTLEQYQEILDYNPQTGRFTWKVAAGGKLAGRRAGSFRNNNYGIVIEGKITSGARLAWLFTHGEWPPTPVRFVSDDHRDISIANLRLSVSNATRDAQKREDIARRARERGATWGREPTQARLHELFVYVPATGKFFWKHSSQGRTLGEPAGSVDNGHMVLRVDGVSHQQQRLAWIYVHGAVPDGQRLRFDNGNGLDCRISNLRLARTKDESNALYHARHPGARRENSLHKYEGMTTARYEEMFTAQGGVCIVCSQPETQKRLGKLRPLVVDHHHDSGIVRGLLCSRCNTMIGYARENAEHLRKAADFVDDHAAKRLDKKDTAA